MSIAGIVLAAVYLIGAVLVVRDDLRATGGSWIRLRGFGTALATAPAQLTIGWMLRQCGVPKVDFAALGWRGYFELAVHVVTTGACLYGLGWALEHVVRWLLR